MPVESYLFGLFLGDRSLGLLGGLFLLLTAKRNPVVSIKMKDKA